MVVGMSIAGLISLIVCLAFLVQGAPYVKSDDETALEIVTLALQFKPARALDIGSGNGKLVILFARSGLQADGIELNPFLVWRSRRNIKKLGLEGRAAIHWGNFWHYDTSRYDLVAIYAIQHIMPKLEQKLTTELPNGAHVISNYFVFPTLRPIEQSNRLRTYRI